MFANAFEAKLFVMKLRNNPWPGENAVSLARKKGEDNMDEKRAVHVHVGGMEP